jgi:hypothetical protein
MGGSIAGAGIYFANWWGLSYTGVTLFPMSNPAWEAFGGALLGALVGLIVAGAGRFALVRPRLTPRESIFAIAILALVTNGVILFMRSDLLVRCVMFLAVVCVAGPWLAIHGINRRHRSIATGFTNIRDGPEAAG